MIKKRHIIVFLSAILIQIAMIGNVKAESINVSDYKYKGYQIPDVSDIPVFDDYNNYIILFNNNNHVFYTILSNYGSPYIVSASASCSYDDFPIAISSSCKSINGGGRAIGTSYRVYYYFYNGQWVQDGGTTNNPLYIQHWYDLVYSSVDLHIGGYNSSSTIPSGFLVDVSTITPTFEVLMNEVIEVNNRDVWRYVWEVANYNSSDYYYEYRLMSFNVTGWLTEWSEIIFNDNLGRYVFDTYDNIRINLRIRSKSDDSIVFDQTYAAAPSSTKEITFSNLGPVQIDDLFHLNYRIGIDVSDYNTLDYYFKVSIDNGNNWYTYFTNNNFEFNINNNTTIIVEVYSFIDNSNAIIDKSSYEIDLFKNGYDAYGWVEGFQYAFLSNLSNGGGILFTKDTIDNLRNKPVISFYNFTTKEVLSELISDSSNMFLVDDNYYCYYYDRINHIREENPGDTIGIIINSSDYSDLGIFYLPNTPNEIYLSYTYFNGAGNDVDNYFKNIEYIDDNGDKQTIVDEDLFTISVMRYIELFFEIASQPIIFIQKVLVYVYKSLHISIKILIVNIFIQMIASALIKMIRR